MLFDDGIDASGGEVVFCDAGTLQGDIVRVYPREGERTHEVLDEIVHTLVVVPESCARIGVQGLSMLSVSQKGTTRATCTSSPVISQ